MGSLGAVGGAGVVLVDFVNGEILGVDVGLEFGLKRGADTAEAVPRDAAEKGVLFDFAGATKVAETMFGIAD